MESYGTDYLPESRTFVMRFFGKPSEEDVARGFQEFESLIESSYGGNAFGIVLNVTEEAHYSFPVLKSIRAGMTGLKRRDFIGAISAVNELQEKVDYRNGMDETGVMPFFREEAEAIAYCRSRLGA
jgi:hypothetical protein